MIEITNVPCIIQKIDKIFHISDVHIRNLKRHEEYSQVFQRTFDYIKANKTENSIIFLGGDIVHAKTDMTPELVQMVQSFFKNCADLCYTVLITGNHDCNLNNKNRLDALAPIVNALNHSNLVYLKESGVYQIANIHFTVMSVFDKPVSFIKANEFTADYKIALHHGAVDNCVTDAGHVLVNKHVPLSLFNGYDLVLLGDIHLPVQYLNAEKTIAYPGSLVQQNYSEALEHGLLEWDVETKTSKFVKIPNDYAFYTLNVEDGQYNMPTNLPKNLRLRLRVKNTDTSDIKTILSKFKTNYNVLETPVQKVNTLGSGLINTNKINLGDVRDIEFQNQLILDFLKSKHNSDETTIDGVRHLNRKCNTLLQKVEINRNVIWIPKKFTFSNMFSYGENNIIDFTNLKGLYGIFAGNTSGKSTLFEALSFCIFDKCNRTSKAEQVLNNSSTKFKSRLEFSIGEDNFVIERNGKKIKEHVKIEVNFYSIDAAGEQKILNGKERSDTNKIIRSYLGTYEDFVLTSLSVQNNNTGFIDMGQKERKELLAQFLDSDIFESLYKIASDECKEIATLIKDLSKQGLDDQLADSNKQLKSMEGGEETLRLEKESKQQEIDVVLEEINKLSTELTPLSNNSLDIDVLNSNKAKIEIAIEKDKTSIQELNRKHSKIVEEITTYKSKLALVDITEIKANLSKKDSLTNELSVLTKQDNKLDTEMHHKESKMEKLKQLEYDTSCKFCMNNVFVKDAIETKSSLTADYEKQKNLKESITKLEAELKVVNEFEQKKKSYDLVEKTINQLESEKLKLENEILKYTSGLQLRESNLREILDNIKFYEEHKEAIEKNAKFTVLITLKRKNIDELKVELQNKERALNTFLIRKSAIESKHTQILNELERLKKLQLEYTNYQLYMEAFSRDGIPYQLIAKALPKIEAEVNNILSQIVDYQITFNTDGKNINAYIVYDSETYWPLELTSGMEKFIGSIAIRTALINVSSLPRPPFLVIDEGMGNLDSRNLSNMYVLFDYLKTQFEYMIVISHIDSMRDMVDSIIEITKVEGKSMISYD